MRKPKPPVLSLNSLNVQAEFAGPRRTQSQFEILVRHLLQRFVHNDLITSDDETKRVVQLSLIVAIPGLISALMLFPAYHSFPPYFAPRSFWDQVGDHYVYVVYTFVLIGAATVFWWDLLFPDHLDIFVLTVLPIPARHLFLARVLAVAIFLAGVTVLTSAFGTILLPLVADGPNPFLHLFAHASAVATSSIFAASTFLALQGILLNTLGGRLFTRLTPIFQGASIILLLTVLVLSPTISAALHPLLRQGGLFVRYFPPFWYLGLYERILGGQATLPIFSELARTGLYALGSMLAIALVTYPLAYRRRVRQITEGSAVSRTSAHSFAMLDRILHATILRTPARRAVFHFTSQTVIRAQRQRVMLAMYAGLGVSTALSLMISLPLVDGRIRPTLHQFAARAAVPILIFWTVAGLFAVLGSPIDRRGSWVFRAILGRPQPDHIAGARMFVTSWATMIGLMGTLLLHAIAPSPLVPQLLGALCVAFLLADIFLYPVRTIPFTQLRRSSTSDMPIAFVRYCLLFPLFVNLFVHFETRGEAGVVAFLKFLGFVVVAHFVLLKLQTQALDRTTLDTVAAEPEDFQGLGLREG